MYYDASVAVVCCVLTILIHNQVVSVMETLYFGIADITLIGKQAVCPGVVERGTEA